jgi:hypothetical protein
MLVMLCFAPVSVGKTLLLAHLLLIDETLTAEAAFLYIK